LWLINPIGHIQPTIDPGNPRRYVLIRSLAEHKTKLAILILLGIASLISVALETARIAYSGSLNYLFLVWNLLLAWIPLGFAAAAYASALMRKPVMYLVILGCAVVWLLFFPNAPYLLTDFQHLSTVVDDVPAWFNVILIIWFAWTGLMLGVVSLYLMQEIVGRILGGVVSWAFVILATGLGALGIYIGRFLRWNSWDVLQSPMPFAVDVLDRIRHPGAHIQSLAFTILFALLFLFIYLTIYLFGHLTYERT
jgi:uncharacterized membrane protein